jgi:hypothetical protein
MFCHADSYASAALQRHNQYRSLHGVPPLTWSSTLAANASSWANGCSFTHADVSGLAEVPCHVVACCLLLRGTRVRPLSVHGRGMLCAFMLHSACVHNVLRVISVCACGGVFGGCTCRDCPFPSCLPSAPADAAAGLPAVARPVALLVVTLACSPSDAVGHPSRAADRHKSRRQPVPVVSRLTGHSQRGHGLPGQVLRGGEPAACCAPRDTRRAHVL